MAARKKETPPWEAEGKAFEQLIVKKGFKPADMARRMKVSADVISNLTRGITRLSPERRNEVAAILDIRPSDLALLLEAAHSGASDPSLGGPAPSYNPNLAKTAQPHVGRHKFQILGTVGASAFPMESPDAGPDDWIDFSDELYRPERFAIQVRGTSMEPEIKDGDYILVQPTDEVARGLLAVAKNRDYEYIVKVLVLLDGRQCFAPLNPEFDPIPLGEGLELVGYAVGHKREVRRGKYFENGDDAGMRPMHPVPCLRAEE